ncbi:MAG: sodium:proton antiporter [Lentimicrobiaceae bacterium]|jgi:Na+/H+ antiporter NhaD/arsenite permease-like protein|nr:sodium:proton antiporter [Lentimicrobiaceae bacterium]MDG1901620.1 sodium:proton antiporter NhaD [Bacteroidales bacterium]MDG2081669.1 sodium:proton antiporter NhaD [Bacteroidales bacterium]
MFILMLVIFILGYTMIALEHPLKIDKAASAILTGTVLWGLYALNATGLLEMGLSPSWAMAQTMATDVITFIKPNVDEVLYNQAWKGTVETANNVMHFVKHDLDHHLVEISEILFFLLGAMTIVETVDQHQGFKLITDRIKTTNKVKLLWVLSILTFFMSATLDNLTTTIVMVALLRKLISDQKTRWFFASMVVLAANAGGAWSPIGDVTTIMLWIGGQITALSIITNVIFPSVITMIVPLLIVTFTVKGEVERPILDSADSKDFTSHFEQKLLLIMGVSALLFVPVFKTVTHLPPYLGMLFGLGVIWLITEIMHRNKPLEDKRKLTVIGILRKVDVPTIFFFLGILSAVAALQSMGHLNVLAEFLNDNMQNIYAINLVIGVLSAIVDNVPLVAGAMGMYPIAEMGATGFLTDFVVDGKFWQFLAYCAGTGGSILIIGSAAGVAAMGLEKIDFIWYMKKISLLALVGYLAGAGAYYLQVMVLGL